MIQNYKNIYFYSICLILLILYFTNATGTGDTNSWTKVQNYMSHYGVTKTYSIFPGYPPLSFTILSIAHYKIMIVVMLLISTWLMYDWKKDYKLFLASFILCCVLGYIDIFYIPFLIGSLWYAEKRNVYGCISLIMIAMFIKWQPLLILPFVLVYCYNGKKINLVKIALPMLLISFFILMYFGYDVVKSGFDSQVDHKYFSANAMNLNWIITYFKQSDAGEIKFIYDSNIYSVWLFRITYSIIFIMFLLSKKEFRDLLTYAMLGFLAYFMFNTGVHENHLIVPMLLAILLGDYLVPVMQNVNLFLFYGFTGSGIGISRIVMGYDITLGVAMLNVIIFFYLLYVAKQNLPKRKSIDYGKPDLGKDGKGLNWKPFKSWIIK